MRSLVLILVLLISVVSNAQQGTNPPEIWREGYVIKDASHDTLDQIERMRAQRIRSENALRALKGKGVIIVRLKTNDKSINAYKAAGRTEIATRMEKERKVMNQKIYDAFSRIVTFCPVYFIYAKDTRDFSAGKKGLLLNANMEYDSSIVMRDTFYVFVEHGVAQGNGYIVADENLTFRGKNPERKFMGSENVTSYSGSNVSDAAMIFLNKDYEQYFDPFPATEGVYLENYNAAAVGINKQLYRAYNRLVTVPDMRKEIKKAKYDAKERMNAPAKQ